MCRSRSALRPNKIIAVCMLMMGNSFWTKTMVSWGISISDNSDTSDQNSEIKSKISNEIFLGSKTRQHVYKRSTDLQQECDDLVRSAQQVCSKIKEYHSHSNSEPSSEVKATAPSKRIFEKRVQFPGFDFYHNSTPPDMVISKIAAKRNGKKVEVAYEIIHSSDLLISRLHSFDAQRRLVKGPTKGIENDEQDIPWISSTVWLALDTSYCRIKLTNAKILITSENSKYRINSDLDICEIENGEEYTQSLNTPKLKFPSNPGDVIIIEDGRDPYLDFEVDLVQNTMVNFEYSLWDWDSQKLIRGFDEALLNDNYEIQFLRSISAPLSLNGEKDENFLYFDILNSTIIKYDTDSDTTDFRVVRAKIRAWIKKGKREISGRVAVCYQWRNWAQPKILDYVTTKRVFSFKLPYKTTALPLNTVEIGTKWVECDNNGKICAIACEAWGTDMKDITIIKSDSYMPPVNSTSYLIDHTFAYVTQYLGPDIDVTEGAYTCIVVFHNGQTKTRIICPPK